MPTPSARARNVCELIHSVVYDHPVADVASAVQRQAGAKTHPRCGEQRFI
jgi:hypothetical protein